jgi:hypothetical protein
VQATRLAGGAVVDACRLIPPGAGRRDADGGARRPRPPRRGRGGAGVLAFDIATLWASLRAFGHAPTGVVIVVGYFVGDPRQRAPAAWAGIGGDRCVLGFGVDGGLAVVAVLADRAISNWLPTLPGAVAQLRLRQTVSDSRAADGQPTTADITA